MQEVVDASNKLRRKVMEHVAWLMKQREPDHGAAYLTFETPTRDMKISHHPYRLFMIETLTLADFIDMTASLTTDQLKLLIEVLIAMHETAARAALAKPIGAVNGSKEK